MADKKKPATPEPTLKITFAKPIEFAGQTYDHIMLEEPTAGQLELAAGPEARLNGVTSNVLLLAELAQVPQEVVRKMKKRDFEHAVEYLQSFA